MREEAVSLLRRLIQFNTVNPPGNEREAQEFLQGYLQEAGLDCELVGATRESVNKWLGAFEKQGLIRYDKGQITLVRPAGLKQRIY